MIYIFKGDSTTFADVEKFLTFYIQTELDLTGWIAEFKLGSIVKTIEDISLRKFDIILSNQETSKLTYGFHNGILKLTDEKGQIKTISNTIPFKVVDTVIENENEIISLDIPKSAEIEIDLQVGSSSGGGSNLNIVAGENINVKYSNDDVVISAEVPDISNLATKAEVATKQPKGDYALVSDIPTLLSQLQNDLGYQTLTDVMGIIASIPQFKLSIVQSLPSTGEKMTLYLVPKEAEEKDIYNEYIWIEQTSSFELIGTTAVDLTDYVKNTDYATSTKAGIMRPANGLFVSGNTGAIVVACASTAQIDAKTDKYYPIVPNNLNYAVNSVLPTMTQSEYDALETKDENLFYMIVEE